MNALSPEAVSAPVTAPADSTDSAGAADSAAVAAAPAASPVQAGRALLKALQAQYAVFRDCRPLAIGIDKQLLAAQPDLDRKALRLALRLHTNSLRYLKVMEKAAERVDLAGQTVATLTDEHRAHATETLKERFRKEAEQKRDQKRAQAEAEKAERAAQQRADKLNQLAAKFAKR